MVLSKFRVQTEESLKSDKISFFFFLFSVVSILLQSSLILTTSSSLPPLVPLFYSRPWGEAQLAPWTFLWILPGLSLAISLLNFSLAIFVFGKLRFLSRTLFIFAFIVAVGTLYGTVKIISLLT